jgi:site-specific recombinase XerD
MTREIALAGLLALKNADFTPLEQSIIDFLFTLSNPATRRIYTRVLKSYLSFLESGGIRPLKIEDLDHKHAQLFKTYLDSINSPPTAHDKMTILSSWYRFEIARGNLKLNPISLLKLKGGHEPKNPTPALSYEELTQIKRHLSKLCEESIGSEKHAMYRRYHCIFNLLLATGARIESICKLSLRRIEEAKEGLELVLKVKGGLEGRVILHPKAALILRTFVREFAVGKSADTGVFEGRIGAITPRAVNYFFKSLARDLKLATNFHPHVMRATMSTILHDQNVSMIDVKQLGLWSDSRMPERYVRIMNRRLHAASFKMPV